MSSVRVTYSGLVTFGIRLTTVFTGIIFTIIVTRELTQEEFGSWGLIGGLILYVTILYPITSYWTTREIARGIESGRTAITTTSFFSIIGIIAYILIVYLVGVQTNVEFNVLLLSSILVPVMFFQAVLNAINLGWKPEAIGYGTLSFEISKIPAALIFVYFLQFGIEGAIISVFIAYVVNNVVLTIYARKRLKAKFRIKILKNWLRRSWLPMYRSIFSLVSSSDVVIFSIITGSVFGIAYVAAARSVSQLVRHTQGISKGVYPKLLSGGKKEYLQENFIRVLYFIIPLFALSVVFARPGLFTLNPIYESAAAIVIFFSIRIFLNTITKLFFESLQAVDTTDVKEDSSFKDLIKSKLFLLPTIRLIQFSTYIVILAIGLSILTHNDASQLDLAVYLSIVSMIIEIPVTLYSFVLVKKEFPLNLDYVAIFKYCLIAIGVFGLVYFLMEKFLIYDKSIFQFLPNLLIFVVIGIAFYIGLTYVSDWRTKNLFRAIIKEIKNRK